VAHEQGFQRHVAKPFDMAVLIDASRRPLVASLRSGRRHLTPAADWRPLESANADPRLKDPVNEPASSISCRF
jgi:hypothetical protein